MKKHETAETDHIGISKDGKKITLKDLFADIGVDPNELSINTLDV